MTTKQTTMRYITTITFMLLNLSFGYAQKQIHEIKLDNASKTILDSVINIQKRIKNFFGEKISIYEFGDELVDCETNFKNLISNWNTDNLTNANDYEFLECSLAGTISDSSKYISYKNYFSSDGSLRAAVSASNGEGRNGNIYKEFYIFPGFAYREFNDTRGLPENIRHIFSKKFLEKAQRRIKEPFSIDTMKLYPYTSFSYNKTIEKGNLRSNGTGEGYSIWNVISPDSLTQNYVDIFLKNKKQIDEIKIAEAQKLILQDIMIKRISDQLYFNQQVNIGDKVYLIKFKYNGMTYSDYVICSSSTNKVVVDNFFQRIKISKDDK